MQVGAGSGGWRRRNGNGVRDLPLNDDAVTWKRHLRVEDLPVAMQRGFGAFDDGVAYGLRLWP